LLTLQRELLSALGEEGLAFADRHYRPHITLARIKSRSTKLSSWWVQQDAVDIQQEFPVTAMTLYESELAPPGAIYRSLATVKLGAA
jgi:2'-5' RNA ligase